MADIQFGTDSQPEKPAPSSLNSLAVDSSPTLKAMSLVNQFADVAASTTQKQADDQAAGTVTSAVSDFSRFTTIPANYFSNIVSGGSRFSDSAQSELTAKRSPAPDFDTEKNILLNNFSQLGDEQQQEKAQEWQQAVEARVTNGQLPASEAARTYEQVNKLLTTRSNFVTDDERVIIAAEILYHTGVGRSDQGLHGTCNVSVLENIAFNREPSLAAEMITSAALTAKYKGADGRIIAIPPESLKPGWEEEKFPPEDGLRSHASQIFQVVALNDVGERDTKNPAQFLQKVAGPGSVFLELGKVVLPWAEYWMPNGYEVWKRANGKETEFEGLSGRQIAEESKRLFGDRYDVLSYKSPYEKISHPFSSDDSDYDGTKRINTEDDLRRSLRQEQASARLPVIVAVNGDNSKIMKDSSLGDMIFNGILDVMRPVKNLHDAIDTKLGVANHVVTVTQYDAAQDKVYIDNSWGKDKDGWISVDDLWQSM